MPIESVTPQSKEKIARLDPARIRAHPQHLGLAGADLQFAFAGISDTL
jgi:hypothetical protein